MALYRTVLMGANRIIPITSFAHPDLLVAYTMDNVSGTTLVDEGSASANLTTINATYATGVDGVNNAMIFDGTTSAIGSPGGFVEASPWAYCMWVRVDVLGAAQYVASHFTAANGNTPSFTISSGGSFTSSKFPNTGGSTFIQATTKPVVGVWYHVVIHQTDTDEAIYVDGVLENTVPKELSNGDAIAEFSLGAFTPDNPDTFPFTGALDQLRVFKRALTQEEITELYEEFD